MLLYEIPVILLLIGANGVLAGAEIALVTLRQARLQSLADKGSRAAWAVTELRKAPERFLATIQIGITLVGATAGAFGGARLAQTVEPWFGDLPGLSRYAQELSLLLVILIISYLSLIFGELVPKSLALRSAERYALLVGRPLRGLSMVTRPLVWFLTASSNGVLRLFGDQTSFTEARFSAVELQEMMKEATEEGSVHPNVGEIASRALLFSELTAADVMISRNHVAALPREANRDELCRVFLVEGHSRAPVYEGMIDNVVGYLSSKDILKQLLQGNEPSIEGALRPAYFVPRSKRVVDLLQEMRARHLPFAIVVDEQGGTAGIVTLEDVIEELVGEIFSEHVRSIPVDIQRETEGSALVRGRLPVREINRVLGTDLPEEGAYTTIAGLCLEMAQRIPSVGERFVTDNGHSLEVVEATAREIRVLRIRRPDPGASD